MEELRKELIKIYEKTIFKGEIKQFPKSVTINDVEIDLLNPVNYNDIKLVTSPFGVKRERVVDEVYRKSKEFKFNQTENVDKRITYLGQRVVDQVLQKHHFVSIPYKFIVYEEGGFFKKHTDTYEKDLIYTLVVILNTDYKGGEFMFGDFDATKNFKKNNLNFILFNVDKPHHINKVISGKRMALTYKVYKMQEISITSDEFYVCDDKLNIPIKEKNVLISFPCIEKLKPALKNYKHKYVYSGEEDPTTVYDKFDEDRHDDYYGSDEKEFDDYVDDSYGSSFSVNKIIKYEYSKLTTCSFQDTRYYGCSGNSPMSEEYDVHYYKFLLINPENDCGSAGEMSTSDDDVEEIQEPEVKRKKM